MNYRVIKVGMEKEYVSLGISIDLEIYKEIGYDYTKVKIESVYYMHQNVESIVGNNCLEGSWCHRSPLIDEAYQLHIHLYSFKCIF
jgi:hypothetical protein